MVQFLQSYSGLDYGLRWKQLGAFSYVIPQFLLGHLPHPAEAIKHPPGDEQSMLCPCQELCVNWQEGDNLIFGSSFGLSSTLWLWG